MFCTFRRHIEDIAIDYWISSSGNDVSQVKLLCQFGPAKKKILDAEKNLDEAKLSVAKLDPKIQKFGADNAKARWVYNFLIAGTQPPPIDADVADAEADAADYPCNGSRQR